MMIKNILISRYFLLGLAILAFSFYQLINLFYFSSDFTFPDEARFLNSAINLYKTGEYGGAWEMPLTAIVFSLFYDLLGEDGFSLLYIRLLQSFLLLLQAAAIYRTSNIIFKNEIVARITYTVFLFYPFFIFYQGLALSETIFNTFLVLSFYFLYLWYEADFNSFKYLLLTNLFFILSLYTKGTLSFLSPLLISLFYFINKNDIFRSLSILLISVLIYILFMSPWWIRNYTSFDEFIPLTTSSALNLYLGNNDHNLSGGIDWTSDVDHTFVSYANSIGNELEVNQVYKEKAINYIVNNPYIFVKNALIKLKRFYNIVPNTDSYNSVYHKLISILSYGIIFILFIWSIVLNRGILKKLSAFYILILYFTILHMIFIASLRYRLPIEPFMILLAISIARYKAI